jgi:hypothetical protein
MLLDRDGKLLECLGPEQPGDLATRRSQYIASATGRDVAVAQWLVRSKRETETGGLHAHGRGVRTGVASAARPGGRQRGTQTRMGD